MSDFEDVSGECKISFVGVYAWSCKKDGRGESWKRLGSGNFAFGAGVLFLLLLGCASGMFLSFGRVNGREGGEGETSELSLFSKHGAGGETVFCVCLDSSLH